MELIMELLAIVSLIFWVIASIAVGYAATQRGRGSGEWFLLSIFLSPILAVLILLACPYIEKAPTAAAPIPAIQKPMITKPYIPGRSYYFARRMGAFLGRRRAGQRGS